MTKRFITLIFFVTLVFSLSAQDSLSRSFKERYTTQCEASYHYQNCNGVELGINFLKWNYGTKYLMEYGPYFSCEYNFIQSKGILAPKFALGVDQLIHKAWGYVAKLNIACYDPTKTNDYRLCPQLGLTYLGIINVYYGYNFYLSKSQVSEIGLHKFSLTINLGKQRVFNNAIHSSGNGF